MPTPEHRIQGWSDEVSAAYFHPKVDIHVLPGGSMPVRKTDGAIGYDASIRAIVSPFEMDPANPLLRKTVFDFVKIPVRSAEINRSKIQYAHQQGALKYPLGPGEQVTVGLGFVTRMPPPLFYWVAPRSGLASKHGISITNAPGTVDPDYRGEAGAVVRNLSKEPFDLYHGLRIVQVIFTWAVVPQFSAALTHEQLLDTARGSGGFGSTGH